MKRLIMALSLVFLIGMFAFSGFGAFAYGFSGSSDQARLKAPSSYQTIEYRRVYRDRDYDRDYYYRDYDYGYYDPYYYSYPYTYYYGPGVSINTPFFGFNIP